MLNSQVQFTRMIARLSIIDGRIGGFANSSIRTICSASGSQSGLIQSKNSTSSSKRTFSNNAKISAESIGSISSISIGSLQPLQPKKQRKRLGRGPGSGRGGTSTKGHKGQKARAGNGKPTPGFEGGQTPIMRRFPKRGFTNSFAKDYVPLSLGRIQDWIDQGRLDPEQPITARELLESSCIHSYGDGVRIFAGSGKSLRSSIHLIVSRTSTPAINVIESLGGSIVCKYYSRTSLEALVKPHKFYDRLPPRDPMPVGKKDLLYYASKARRGYLADRVPEARKTIESNAIKNANVIGSEEVHNV